LLRTSRFLSPAIAEKTAAEPEKDSKNAQYGSWVKADRSSNVPARECFHGTGAATPGARNGKALTQRAIGRLNGQSIVNSCHAKKK
jgi:hypothetical protein